MRYNLVKDQACTVRGKAIFFIKGDIMGTKPFSPIDEQIKILKDRGLIIVDENKTKTVLLRENYYNVINGYKIPFLKRGLDGELINPEEFTTGCTFSEIYSLHNLDRALRHHLLKYLLKFETHFKTSCAYNFSEKFKAPYSYLSIANYSSEKKVLSDVLKNIAALSAEVNRNTNIDHPKSPYIGHYIKKHDSVPLWVLVNSLTIGNMSYFYSALDDGLKDIIAKDFSMQYKREYESVEKIESDVMIQIVKMVNLFRNICAHEEVLFLFSLDKKIQSSIFLKYFNNGAIEQNDIKKSDLYTLILLMKLVLPKNEYLEFIDYIEKIFDTFSGDFKSVKFEDIILLSGFKKDWKSTIISNL